MVTMAGDDCVRRMSTAGKTGYSSSMMAAMAESGRGSDRKKVRAGHR